MSKVVVVLALLAGWLVGAMLLTGCDSSVDNGQANLERTRSENRINESEVAHRQAMETLLYVVVCLVGGTAMTALAVGLVAWIVKQPPRRQADTDLLLLLDEQRRQLAAAERAAWRLVANEQRRQLGAERRVTIYDERR